MDLVPSPSQTIGPFFHIYFDAKGVCGCIAGAEAKGEHIQLTCRVVDGDGVPIPDALIELWQTDAQGIFNHPADERHGNADPAVLGFGRLPTDNEGICVFETVRPGRIPAPAGSSYAPHIVVSVFGRGLLKRLVTRIYFAGDSANRDDSVLALVSQGRRETLMAHPDSTRLGLRNFDIRLSGDDETVFFDV